MTPYIVKLPSGAYINLSMLAICTTQGSLMEIKQWELTFSGVPGNLGSLNDEDRVYLLDVLDHLAALASPIPATAKED